MTADTFVFRKNGTDSALIFLHGFTGDIRETWGDFPMRLMGNAELNDWDIFSVGYTSTLFIPDQKGLWKAAPDIQKLADTLVTRMEFGFDQYRKIAFAAHSMGGLVVQRALLDLDSDEIREKISHVFLFGTPSNGLIKAVIAAKLVGKRQVRDMAEGCPFIVRLRRDWEKEFGYDNFPFHFQSVSGDQDEFVPDTSAHGNFPRAHCRSIPGGHLDIVKPTSPDHLAVRIVAKGLRERRSRPENRTVTLDEIDPHQQLPREHQKWAFRFLLRNAPDSEWVEPAYRKAVSAQERKEWGLPEPGSVNWCQITRVLLEFPLSPLGFHPLVPFLRSLGKQLDRKSPESAAYFQSVDAIAKHLGHKGTECGEPGPCRLLIELQVKSASDTQVFTARIHEWREGTTSPDDPPPPFSGTESQIVQGLSRFLDGRTPDELPASVEVFVSPDHLAYVRPHEWLRVDDPDFSETFGESYPTVVRLNRRDFGFRPEWINRWKRRWERLNSSNPCGKEEVEESDLGNMKALLRKLRRTEANPFLTAPFSIPKETAAFGQVLWRAGIPVALWGGNDGMDSLMGEYSALPDRLYAHRRDNADSCLSLMWDDPDRLPPTMTYQKPGQMHVGPPENGP